MKKILFIYAVVLFKLLPLCLSAQSFKTNNLNSNLDSSILKPIPVITADSSHKKAVKSYKDSLLNLNDSIKVSLANKLVQKSKTISNQQIKINGSLRNYTHYGSNFLNGQETPLFYNRTFLDLNVSLWGLPINMGYNYSTEDALLNKQISMFQIHIDQYQIQEYINNNKQKSIQGQLNNSKLDSLSGEINNRIKEITSIIEALNNQDYNKEIEKCTQIVLKAKDDSIFANSKKIKVALAKEKLNNYQKQTSKIDSLERLRKQLTQKLGYLTALNDKEIDISNIAEDTVFGRVNTKAKPRIPSVLQRIKNFGIGDIYPNYSTLFMNGFMMRGIQSDFQFKNFYLGYSGGITNNTGNQNPITTFSKNAKVHAGQIGIGNQNTNSIGFIFLTGEKELHVNEIKGNIPARSNVIGLRAKVDLLGYGILEFERAVSNTYRVNPEIQFDEFSKTIKKSQLNAGTLIKLSGNIKETNTKYFLSYVRNDLYFYSIANPLQRSDCKRSEIRLEQGFYKNKIGLIIGWRNDKDNLSLTKKYTTTSNNYELGFKLKLKHSRTALIVKNTVVSNSMSKGNMLNLNSININHSRNDKVQANRLLTNMNYSYLFFNGQLDTLMNNTHILALMSSYLIGTKLTLKCGYNHSRPQNNSKNLSQYDLNCGAALLLNKKFTIEGQFLKMNYRNIEIRNNLKFGMIYKIKKISISGFADNQFIKSKFETTKFNYLLIFNLDLVFQF